MTGSRTRGSWMKCVATITLAIGAAELSYAGGEPLHSFDLDPHWERFGITASGDRFQKAVQEFGWRHTNHAGGAAPGEIGGVITRAFDRSVYWTKIGPKTLNDNLTISGRFAVRRTEEHSALMLGFFNEDSRGRRPINALYVQLGGENKPANRRRPGQFSWVFANVKNSDYVFKGVGAFNGRLADTDTAPIASDGKPHDFLLVYDPSGGNSRGEIGITIDRTTWKGALPPGFKKAGATFNRFGLMNTQYGGHAMEFYFDDLRVNGESFDFTQDPNWEGMNNHVTFSKLEEEPYHDLRWSNTNYAGSEAGELLVTMWANQAPAYYADKIGPLTLEDELYAEGRL